MGEGVHINLYLIRHGDAETDKPDEVRSLTQIGRETVQKVAKLITKRAEPPAIILCSPLKRAVETAEFFAKGWKVKVERVEWLRADVEPSVVIEELRNYFETFILRASPDVRRDESRSQSVALVGHLPNLGLLMGVLLWGLPPKEIVIPKAGVAYLTLSAPEPASARLKWLVTPEII